MALFLGDKAPDFTADTSKGQIRVSTFQILWQSRSCDAVAVSSVRSDGWGALGARRSRAKRVQGKRKKEKEEKEEKSAAARLDGRRRLHFGDLASPTRRCGGALLLNRSDTSLS